MDLDELEETYQFQDFVQELLYKSGMPICCYASKKYNIEKGESIGGVEIKHDKRMKDTGNIYIEFAEKHYQSERYVYSGILRKDNTTFYAIGDFHLVLLLSKEQLLATILSGNFKRVQTETSIGYLVPLEYLYKHRPLIIIEWRDGKRYEKEVEQVNKTREKQVFNIYW